MALTEEFKNKYMRIATEEGYFGKFDWDKIEKQLEAAKAINNNTDDNEKTA